MARMTLLVIFLAPLVVVRSQNSTDGNSTTTTAATTTASATASLSAFDHIKNVVNAPAAYLIYSWIQITKTGQAILDSIKGTSG